MPRPIANRVQRKMDHLCWVIDQTLANYGREAADAKRDRDAAPSDRHEFWEVNLLQGTVFICLHTTTDGQATEHGEVVQLSVDLRDADGEPLPLAPSVLYQHVPSNIIRPLLVDYLDTIIEGRR